jgi:hypothetical protein
MDHVLADGGEFIRQQSVEGGENLGITFHVNLLLLLLMRIWFLAHPLALGVARVKENWFSIAFILRRSCQPRMSLASVNFCRFFGGFGPSQGRWRAVAGALVSKQAPATEAI